MQLTHLEYTNAVMNVAVTVWKPKVMENPSRKVN